MKNKCSRCGKQSGTPRLTKPTLWEFLCLDCDKREYDRISDRFDMRLKEFGIDLTKKEILK